MELTREQQAMLDGAEGPDLALALKTLVRYGESFQAPRLVPIKSAHLTGSFAIVSYSGYYELLDRLVAAGVKVRVPTTINPRPGYDYTLQNKIAFRDQKHHEAQLAALGVTGNYSCVCYHSANVPALGDVVGWAESSAVIYANSVLGARSNRNSIMVDVCMAVTGLAPDFGLLWDENRKAQVLVRLDVDDPARVDDDAVGFLVGQRVVDRIPAFAHVPLDKVQLKNMGATMAAAGAIGMFHVEKLTPECPSLDAVFADDPQETIVITQRDIDGLRLARPRQEESGMVVFGCPQMTQEEVEQVGRHFVGKKVKRKTLFHVVPGELAKVRATALYGELQRAGVELFEHCPLAGLTVRLSPKNQQVLTNSGKLHYYLQGAEYGNLDDMLAIAGVL